MHLFQSAPAACRVTQTRAIVEAALRRSFQRIRPLLRCCHDGLGSRFGFRQQSGITPFERAIRLIEGYYVGEFRAAYHVYVGTDGRLFRA
jgi:hypothetical protein